MVIEGMQALPTLVHQISPWQETILGGLNHLLSIDWLGLAQLKTDTDLFGQVTAAWDHFVKTGQIWALLIGIVFGYMIKAFTTF